MNQRIRLLDEHRILVDAIHDSATVIHKGQRMNERIRLLAEQAGYLPDSFGVGHWDMPEFHNFVQLFKEALMQELAGEYVGDPVIDTELDIEDRCYLRGSNAGITDAIIIVQNFGDEL